LLSVLSVCFKILMFKTGGLRDDFKHNMLSLIYTKC
jgi:hypothetical protein